jgi:hypothetical protein
MSRRALAVLVVLLCAALLPAGAIDPRQHSDSATKQFSVFCEDVPLRMRVVSFAEEVKRDVLQLLGEGDAWRAPIVIAIQRGSTSRPGEPAAQVRLIESMPGFKVQIDVRIGDDPTAVNLQKQIVRAVLLEYAYREAGVKGGTEFREAPWWVVEGAIQIIRQRETGANSDLFKRLIETNKLPPLESFLTEKPDELGVTARAVDQALAACLLQLLASQPGGKASLARLVRAWPQSDGDPAALLRKAFPALAADEATLQKWWTLGLARFAAADRYKGLNAAETEKELEPLLSIEIPAGKPGEKKTFALGDFAQFIKLPASRAVLAERHTLIIALSARAHALHRPVLTDYEQVFSLLARRKTGGVRERLARIEEYRATVLRRTGEIADYLNWFEGTQMGVRSHAFDGYLKTANEISEQERKPSDAISRYLDAFEHAF